VLVEPRFVSHMQSSFIGKTFRGAGMKDQTQASGSAEERASYSAPALEKGLAILEVLAAAGEPLSARSIAERLGRSKNEIFRMIFVLLECGYLAREPGTDRLVLTNRLFNLGIRTPRARQLVEVAVPIMEEVSDQSEHSAHLVVLSQGETVVIAATAGGSDLSLTLRLGYRRSAVDATSGLIILAFLPRPLRQRLVEESAAQAGLTPKVKEILATLDEVGRQGYLISDSRDLIGVTDIGCPILRPDGQAVASIVIPYLNRHRRPARHQEVCLLLQRACASISAQIV
jgi:DNA-binding IclR family transcriptional regulator